EFIKREDAYRENACRENACPSIDPLQRGGLAFLDRRGLGSGARLVIQKLARQALLADNRIRVRRLTAARADVGKPVLGAAQAEITNAPAKQRKGDIARARVARNRYSQDMAQIPPHAVFLMRLPSTKQATRQFRLWRRTGRIRYTVFGIAPSHGYDHADARHRLPTGYRV